MQKAYAFLRGAGVATLGGLIGLSGGEFRLPVLVGFFKYRTLQAIVSNLVVSLVTVAFSFIFRIGFSNLNLVTGNIAIILNILAGSMIGAYLGANFAARINERTLTSIVRVTLLFLSFVLIGHEFITESANLQLSTPIQLVLGILAGIVIGVVSSMLGVAGGELIILTIVLVFAKDIKFAGTLSLMVSIPTISMALVRYQRQAEIEKIRAARGIVTWMALASMGGALVGSYLVQFASSSSLYILLGLILLMSVLGLRSQQKPPMRMN